MRGIFIAGTDTGVGKTIVTGLLARYLSTEGYSVITQKWVETGTRGLSKDIDMHLKLMGKRKKNVEDLLPHMSPYVFRFASSPHLAAQLEGKRIDAGRIKKSFEFLKKRHDFVIVEGIGGALVPYNRRRLVIDIAKELKLSVIIVAENKLGAINHTLLTIEAIKKRNMKLIGIIFNNWRRKTDKRILSDNIRIIKRWIAGLKKT